MYIRASDEYRTANGEAAMSTAAAHAVRRPPARNPAAKVSGRATTPRRPDRARTATVPVPNSRIQPWSIT